MKVVRVLIVEDEPKLVASLKKGLEKEGYIVEIALDGESGAKRAQYGDFEVILLDLMLPLKDGLTVCRELRRNEIETPILMLTARDSLDDRVLGLDSGADDYLVKPFSFEELLARLRAILRRSKEVIPPVLKIDDLTLDPAARKVMRGGKEITLTTREFALLQFLMRNAGQVLSRDQILDRIWDASYEGWSNVIDVHIMALRKKIDAGKPKKLIQTIRGVGYTLKE